jgi:hypothetical protein
LLFCEPVFVPVRKRLPASSGGRSVIISFCWPHPIEEGGNAMPDEETTERAEEDLRERKSPSTAAGEFVHEEIEHVREGKHGARSPKQAIAIGLSKARRAGIPLKPPAGQSAKVRKQAERDTEKGRTGEGKHPSRTRSQAREKAMEKEPRGTTSHRALSKQTKSAARKRSAGSRSAAAQKAVRTKGPAGRNRAAKKAARTRARWGLCGRLTGSVTGCEQLSRSDELAGVALGVVGAVDEQPSDGSRQGLAANSARLLEVGSAEGADAGAGCVDTSVELVE